MTIIAIALVFALLACGLAWRANARFRSEKRLPMQWWLDGQVTWSAPRPLALAFIPAVTILILTTHAVLALTVEPRAGQEHLVIPVTVIMGLMAIAVQLLHIWMIAKTLRRAGG